MNKLYKGLLATVLFVLLSSMAIHAQTIISGTVTDAATGETIAGVNIIIRGKVIGTITGTNGEFSLSVSAPPPFTLLFSFVGYQSQEMQITSGNTSKIDIKLQEQTVLGQEIVGSASRVE